MKFFINIIYSYPKKSCTTFAEWCVNDYFKSVYSHVTQKKILDHLLIFTFFLMQSKLFNIHIRLILSKKRLFTLITDINSKNNFISSQFVPTLLRKFFEPPVELYFLLETIKTVQCIRLIIQDLLWNLLYCSISKSQFISLKNCTCTEQQWTI